VKRLLAVCAAALLALSAAGCASQDNNGKDGTNIYYINGTGDGLSYEASGMSTVYSEELIDDIMEELQDPQLPEGQGSSVFQNGITVSSYTYDGGTDRLYVDLSGDYGSLENTGKLLLTAGITLTFEQVDGISDVYITIQGEPLLDTNGEDLGSLSADDFVIHTGNEINIYTSASMKLYFLNEDGDKLVPETRTVYYNSNVPLEQVVLEELIQGPQESGHTAALANTLGFLSVTIQEDVCYVNFDENVVQAMAMYDCELALESIVQSIDSVCNVSKVQFSVNGDTLVEFADGTTIDHIYEAG
jgi:germination protein M